MNISRVTGLRLGFLLSLLSLPLFSQTTASRFGGVIKESGRTSLEGSRNPRAIAANDAGAVSPDMAVPGITLVFRRTPAQETALQDLLSAQQDPKSPQYHHWLTPETFAARFGMDQQDVATVEAWLQSYGFRIDNVGRSRDRITFSGTAAQVREAFGTELHSYRQAGEVHFAPSGALTLPASLASATQTVLHLSNFRPKPSVKAIPKAQPAYTSATTQAHYLTPIDIYTMYDATSFYNQQTLGEGQAVAIVGQSFVNTSSIGSFQTYLTRATPISLVLVPDSGPEAISPGDEGESEIDLEYASGIAATSNVFFVFVGANQNYGVYDALAFAISQDIAPVVSISYSTCETLLSSSDLSQYNALFEEASAQGQTLVASSGDSGSTACAPYTSAEGVTVAEQQALTVNFPASSPNVTAVGGTQMAPGTFEAGNTSYWAGAVSYNGDTVSSLLSYVAETTWNEGSATTGILAGGGGSSAIYPRPAWQAAVPGMSSGSYRLLPDLSLQASVSSPGYLICTSDPMLLSEEGQTSGCLDGLAGNNGEYTVAGGTSFAAPIFAGFLAILNQFENSNGQGNVNPELYGLAANSETYATVFHDITSGSNACVASSGDCVTANESSYDAAPGYDEATGLGSIDVAALAAAWPSSNTRNLQSIFILLNGSGNTADAGQTVPVQISVSSIASSGATAPTGSLSVSVDGQVVNPDLPFSYIIAGLNLAQASYNLVAPGTTGSHLLTVSYSGDSTHAPATATYSVLVGNVLATGGMNLSASNLSVASNGTGTTQVAVTPTNGYNGRVVWSLSATGTSDLTACFSIDSIPVGGMSTTPLTIGVGTACKAALSSDGKSAQGAGQSMRAIRTTSAFLGGMPATGAYACLLVCGCLAGARRRFRLSLLLVLAMLPIAGMGVTGCGGGGSTTGTTKTTTPTSTSYTLTLTGTDSVNSAITASTTFTLTVN